MKRRRIDERAQQNLETLRQRARERDAELQAIAADGRYSADYARDLATIAKQRHLADGRDDADRAWRAARRRRETARKNLEQAAADYEATYTPAIEARERRYRAELDRPLGLGESRVQRLAQLAEQAQHTQEGRLALASIVLSGDYAVGLSDPELSTVAKLTTVAATWEEQARGPLAEAQAELEAAETGVLATRETVLDLEAHLSDAPRSIWNPLTPWTVDVLGESAESLGLVGVRGDAVGSNAGA